MTDVTSETYECPKCGVRSPWRPEAAGRPVGCDCGATLTVPFVAGPAELANGSSNGKAVVRESPAHSSVATDTEVLVDDADEDETDESAGPATRNSRWAEEDSFGLPLQARLILAAVVTLAGVLGQILYLGTATFLLYDFDGGTAVIPLLVLMAVGMVALALALCVAADAFGLLDFGRPAALIPPIAAVVTAPPALAGLLHHAFGAGLPGWLVGWIGSFALAAGAVWTLPALPWRERWGLLGFSSLAVVAVFPVLLPLPSPWDHYWGDPWVPVVQQCLLTAFVSMALFLWPTPAPTRCPRGGCDNGGGLTPRSPSALQCPGGNGCGPSCNKRLAQGSVDHGRNRRGRLRMSRVRTQVPLAAGIRRQARRVRLRDHPLHPVQPRPGRRERPRPEPAHVPRRRNRRRRLAGGRTRRNAGGRHVRDSHPFQCRRQHLPGLRLGHAPGAIVCTQCGYHKPRPKDRGLGRRSRAARAAGRHDGEAAVDVIDNDDDDAQPVRDEQRFVRVRTGGVGVRPAAADGLIPLGLTLAGLAIEVALLARAWGPPTNWSDALSFAPLLLVLAAGAAAIACLIGAFLPSTRTAAPPMGFVIGRLVAACVAPAAVGALAYAACGGGWVGLVGGLIALAAVHFALAHVLFAAAWADAAGFVASVCIAQAVVLAGALWPLDHVSAVMGGVWHVLAPVAVQSAVTGVAAAALAGVGHRRG